MAHIPVLLDEVVRYLEPEQGKWFVDATAGGGGHLKAILEKNPTAHVLGIDLDQACLDKLYEELVPSGLNQRIKLVQGNYKNIDKILDEAGVGQVDGIILDLGFSSNQVDDPKRGFSFSQEGPLDMRYDSASALNADTVVNRYSAKDLETVLDLYGEERFARRIAKAIVDERPITNTLKLAEAVKSAIPLPVRFKATDNVRRVFQAIRIEVNSELENLKQALPKMLSALNSNGRLVVISFHSLEDRIVKEFFVAQARDCVCPPEFPTCICDKTSTLRILTRKPVTATPEEIQRNPRSKPAKLRAAAKI